MVIQINSSFQNSSKNGGVLFTKCLIALFSDNRKAERRFQSGCLSWERSYLWPHSDGTIYATLGQLYVSKMLRIRKKHNVLSNYKSTSYSNDGQGNGVHHTIIKLCYFQCHCPIASLFISSRWSFKRRGLLINYCIM